MGIWNRKVNLKSIDAPKVQMETSSLNSSDLSDQDENQDENKLNRDIDRDRKLLNLINLGISKPKETSSVSDLLKRIEDTQRTQNQLIE